MSHYVLSEAAQADVEALADYIAQDSPLHAVGFLDRLIGHFERLADLPHSAPARPDLAPNLRSRPVGSYVVYYRPLSDGIEVARVLHGRRDIGPDDF